MNVVIFAAYAINGPHFETELEIADRHAGEGDRVTLLTCGGQLNACDPNPYHDPPRCAKCMGRRDAGLKLLPPSVSSEPFYRLTDDDRRELEELPLRFASHDELKRFRVGGFDIGYAALSSLITKVRDPQVDLAAHARLLRGLLRGAWIAYRSMCRFLDEREASVDRVYVFNGRLAAMRAVLRACQERGVECCTHERALDPTRYVLFRNTTIHDRKAVHEMIWDAWRSAGDDPDREEVAAAWFKARDRGEVDEGFSRRQSASRLPADWDPDRHNVAVFVSSEDEFASVSDDWRNPLYGSQVEGLRAIIESLGTDPGDVHLYIRTHPNLALVDNVQTREIRKLQAPFVTVIPPADPVDTYEMMRRSASVLTFGSTTGIEAVYWGTPSILAGISFYRDFGGTYNPRTHEELVELLRADLEPRPVEPALAYGYFWPTFGVPFRHFVPDGFYTGRFKGVRVRPSPAASVRIALLRLTNPQRVVRHLKRVFTKRGRILRNRLRRRV